jgi:ABC-2 type transport system ATP-binding protein
MRILTCYHFPTAGTARVDSHDVLTHPHLVRQAVGYLPENAPLYDDMRVREYLAFIADARGLTGALRAQRMEMVVDACGLSEVFSREIRRLSKGYRQRVGLAQAILHDPPVLVLDEPTSGLDPNQIVEIRALIRDLGREKTVILSTHILQEVEALCRRVLIMNAGKLIAQGTPEEIAGSMKEGMVLCVSFKGSLEEATARSLGSLEGVRAVAAVRRLPDERVEVDLDVAPGTDPSETVYDWAVAHGCKILGMRTEKASLEDLFARLTARGRDA